MKYQITISALFLSIFLLTNTGQAKSISINEVTCAATRWEKLGQKNVNYRVDRDEITVTAREGLFTALKLKVRNGSINLHRCIVHFANGESQALQIRNQIPAGGETRILDLEGNRRIITKVVFWYDTRNAANRRAIVSLWGRH